MSRGAVRELASPLSSVASGQGNHGWDVSFAFSGAGNAEDSVISLQKRQHQVCMWNVQSG